VALVVAVVVVIIASICYRSRREKFLTAIAYNPCFIDPLGSTRYTCKGYTSGYMPSIETEAEGGWLCPGLIGVPP
jgi:hypothetical protein